MKKLLVLIFSFVLFSCNNVGHKNLLPENSVQNINSILYTVQLQATDVKTNKIKKNEFTSFHIGSGYIITCKHCVFLPPYIEHRGPFGVIYEPVEYKDYQYTYNGLKLTLIGYKDDVAVLYLKELNTAPSIGFTKHDLKIGDFLIIAGNSFMSGVNFKTGIVSKIGVKEFMDFKEEFLRNSFVTDSAIISGDSGGPVFVVDKGTNQVYIGGMAYGTILHNNYGFILQGKYLQKLINGIIRRYYEMS